MPSTTGQHMYRERAQPQNRKRFGHLEKKQDWKIRAKEFKKKKAAITKLKLTAKNKNPNEFYFGMVGKSLKGGIFKEEVSTLKKLDKINQNFKNDQEEDAYLDNLLGKDAEKDVECDIEDDNINFQDKNLQTNYDLNFVRQTFQKQNKILQKFKQKLGFTTMTKLNKHVHFISDDEEAENVASRLKLEKAEEKRRKIEFENFKNGENVNVSKKMLTQYRQFSEQIEKVEKIKILLNKLENRRKIAKDDRPCQILEKESESSAGQYKWMPRRYK